MENKYRIGYKTLYEKEKLLVTSNFSFSQNVFYSFISLVGQNAVLCGNGLIIVLQHEDEMVQQQDSNKDLIE